MKPLDKTLRNQLERVVKEARDLAEAGARSALEQLGVGDSTAPGHLSEPERDLRRRLRIHGRQLGDNREEKRGTQEIERLVEELAYEHWHRMLFARFLAENNLLMYPDPQEPVAISLAECEDMAADEGAGNGWELASRYAAQMLPQIFRPDSPVFGLELPPEHQQGLERFVGELPTEVFAASDSLGWVYQFWQARRKDQVNASEVKIGARELPAVTQLFTEDYMVDFLLDNTLGAWHAGKVLATNPKLAETAKSEDEVRGDATLPGCPWAYLRFIKSENNKWTPAAGTFEGWPTSAMQLKCLDPCMGSGHFVVAMFERLVALRMAEEKLDEPEAVAAVIRDNLFGLEIDPRCTQIAAFNLALAAWRRVGYYTLPPMNLACSGLAPNTSEAEWLKLAAGDEKLENGMASLYQLFQNAPFLGSLIDPCENTQDLLVAGFLELKPILEEAMLRETNDSVQELAVAAQGIAAAANILTMQFDLVVTNVPFLGFKRQADQLRSFCAANYPLSESGLETVFIERMLKLSSLAGVVAFVANQTWTFQPTSMPFRKMILDKCKISMAARLGPGAFETITGEVVNVCLLSTRKSSPETDSSFFIQDLQGTKTPSQKSVGLKSDPLVKLHQATVAKSPGAIISVIELNEETILSRKATAASGLKTGDRDRFNRVFWEVTDFQYAWDFYLVSSKGKEPYTGRTEVIFWQRDEGELSQLAQSLKHLNHVVQNYKRGQTAWGKKGIAVSATGKVECSIYCGEKFDSGITVVILNSETELSAFYCYSRSGEFEENLRKIDSKLSITTSTTLKVPFDVERWKRIASTELPDGLPRPLSKCPTQWFFDGQPLSSQQPLQVAVARLVGYCWPRQSGVSFPDCPELGPDGLESLSDKDGIVCIPPVRGEASAADRLLNLLAKAYGDAWSSDVLPKLLKEADFEGKGLETWLRDGFFLQHCELFHQRPFVWHIWDGLRDGFSALVNYHKLDHKNLETLIYTYLGDWISRCESEDKAQGLDEDGEKTTAAKNLKRKLEWILEGQAPYDIFVRWKPLHQHPVGWNPDINDGVRMNIRPFVSVPDVKTKGAGVLRVNPKIKWDKDRGTEPERSKQDYPWFWGWDEKTTDFTGGPEFKGERFNDCHYTLAAKQRARESSK